MVITGVFNIEVRSLAYPNSLWCVRVVLCDKRDRNLTPAIHGLKLLLLEFVIYLVK